MVEENLNKLRKLVGQHDHLVYRAVKAGEISHLSGESVSLAEAIQDHLNLRHIHNALEYSDVREGQPYEVEYQGGTVNPLAHVYGHAAVKESIKHNEGSRSAFAKLLSEGISRHHGEHVLSMIVFEAEWHAAHGGGKERFQNSLKKICASKKFRRKWIEGTSAAHPWAA